MRRYALEFGFLARLRADRRELFALARSMGSAAEMRAARAELMASSTVNLAPKSGASVALDIRDGVAHIPIMGELTPHAETDACGAYTAGTLTEYGFIQAALIAAEDNPEVREIALEVNSPGGYIDGIDETAQVLAMIEKPVTAYVGGMAASAAYWLASQADRIVAMSPASEVGSIGIAMEEYDDDDALASEGIAHRVYTSTDAPDKRPDTKTEEGRAKIVANLDALHGVFVRRVAEGRDVSPEVVRESFGRGALVIAEKALSVGMLDEVRGAHFERAPKTEESEKGGVAAQAEKANKKAGRGNKPMTLDQLKAEHPDAYKEARAEGIQAERERVAHLSAFEGINAETDKAVKEAVASGKTYAEVSPIITAAVARGSKLDAENAPLVESGAAANAGGVGDVLDDLDREAMGIFGTSAEDYRRYHKKEGK